MRIKLAGNRFKVFAFILLAPLLISWGSFGHERINRAAVLALPRPMQSFFYNHIDFITQESSVPDIRRSALNDKAEVPRHYIDLENYGDPAKLPATLAEVNTKYDQAFLQLNGILPWEIMDLMEKLTKAFRQNRKTEILFLAADLGHYIGDAHMPLHTTVNYDGQLSDQKGIHSFFESKVTEMFGNTYDYNAGKAVYIKDIPTETWRIINASHALCDTLLIVDRELKKQLRAEKVYQQDTLGENAGRRNNSPVYTEFYTRQYHQRLNGLIERQLRSAITAAASFWYTAWVNAGEPDLSGLDPEKQTKRNKCNLKKELKQFRKGKLMDLKTGKE